MFDVHKFPRGVGEAFADKCCGDLCWLSRGFFFPECTLVGQ